jgi:uncharacterized protein YdaU (DUF1376 family)
LLWREETLKEFFLANRSKKWIDKRTDDEKARLKAEANAKLRERYRQQVEAMGKTYSEGKQRKSLDQLKKDLRDPTKSRRPKVHRY